MQATELKARRDLARDIQSQAFIDVAYIPLGPAFPRTAYGSDLAGVLRGFPIFWNVERT